MLRTNQLAGPDEVYLEREDNGGITRLLTLTQDLSAGDTLLLRAKGSILEVWRNNGSSWSRLGLAVDSTYATIGSAGIGLRGTSGRLDDFGARTLGGASAPTAPLSLQATSGNAQVALSWSPPASDGGSQLSGYRVYRGTSPGGEGPSAIGTPSGASYTDTTAANGTTYYYKVTAVNSVGEGPASNEASATPAAIVPPASPLVAVDSFNRANENPLTDSARWSNSIVGGTTERGFIVSSNTLACSLSTTCTAWRNNAQYGPDVEVWAKITTLPGTGNALRLYARLQQAGTAGFDGYMLRTTQLAGTDEVYLEREDNGAITRLATLSQELAAGDTLLLRAAGSTVEAWRNNGSSWSRLGSATDSTYAATGAAGIGLRGTTGRLDDFGARTMGVAPATAPSAPQSLQATAGNAQVSLAWTAPSSNGGSAITGYRVYRGTAPNPTVALSPDLGVVTSFLDTGRTNGQIYYYKVTALNAIGESVASNEANATPSAPASAPSAPQSLQATAGNAQVSLALDAPSSNGGSAITGYRVYRGTAPNPTVALSPDLGVVTSFLDTGRTNGQIYYYKVTALNAIGESVASNEANATPSAPASAPSAPQSLQATAGNAQVSSRWTTPSSNGGSAITGYRVYRGTAPNPTVALTPDLGVVTSFLDTGRTNGQIYYYKVTALNAIGESVASNEANATPSAPATAPSAPQSLQATAGNAQVSSSWTAPSSNGGSAITGYRVYRGTAPNPTVALSPDLGVVTSFLDTGRTNGQIYYYKVTALNAIGESVASNEANATPSAPASAPSAPQSLQATAGNAQVSLAWTAPSSNGGSAITGYRVYRGTAPNPTVALSPDLGVVTSFLDTGRTNGQIYYYKVTALNAIGESVASNEANATPSDLVLPIEPLSILDTFNRANENPLSFASRWGNGILGSPSEASRSSRTNVRAIGRRRRLLGGRRSSALTPRRMPRSQPFPETETRSACMCACRHRDPRRSTGTCSSSRRRAGPTS